MKYLAALAVLFALALSSCSSKKYVFRKTYQESTALMHDSILNKEKPFLKAHMKNGDLYVFSQAWTYNDERDVIEGYGQKFDFNRKPLDYGHFAISVDSIAIIETNKKLERTNEARIAGLAILAGVDAVIGLLCLTNPKACFGSCPTFYIRPHESFHDASAEGFSNAVVPAFEYTDVDALRATAAGGSIFSLWMKNEALETHCVNTANLIAVPRPVGATILHGTDNNFYACSPVYGSTQATNGRGEEITSALKEADMQEYRSEADSTDLSKKEEILIEFDGIPENVQLGLKVTYRQSLLVSYLFYSVMGYMGDNISELFAELESNPKTMQRINNGVKKLLGNIEVFAWEEESRKYVHQGYFYEEGPIARNTQVLPLAVKGSHLKIKLIVTKGFWRLDEVALTQIISTQEPIFLNPTQVLDKAGKASAEVEKLNDSTKYLISLPGDVWELHYKLPEGETLYDVFLATRGYYLEWMREHWIKDKDLRQVYMMLYHPKKFLKSEAATYKANEQQMEEDFWNSRIDVKTFSYD
jgi:hypothetical protein